MVSPKICLKYFSKNFQPKKQICGISQNKQRRRKGKKEFVEYIRVIVFSNNIIFSLGTPCHGDSGGPLICQNKKNHQWFLFGLISWGSNNCDVHKPAVFTKVSKYASFIEDK